MKRMEYRGYTAVVEYDTEDDCFVGRIVGIADRIVFDGEDTAELHRDFHEVLNTYLKHCEEIGKMPEHENNQSAVLLTKSTSFLSP